MHQHIRQKIRSVFAHPKKSDSSTKGPKESVLFRWERCLDNSDLVLLGGGPGAGFLDASVMRRGGRLWQVQKKTSETSASESGKDP